MSSFEHKRSNSTDAQIDALLSSSPSRPRSVSPALAQIRPVPINGAAVIALAQPIRPPQPTASATSIQTTQQQQHQQQQLNFSSINNTNNLNVPLSEYLLQNKTEPTAVNLTSSDGVKYNASASSAASSLLKADSFSTSASSSAPLIGSNASLAGVYMFRTC
jgi:hypothetical protein